jgi:hypothetical protein
VQVRIGSEVDVVGIQGSGIAVVVVDHRKADARLQRAPHVEAPPRPLGEVRRATDADDALRAGRTWGVQADRGDLAVIDADVAQDEVHHLGHRLDGRLGTFGDPAGNLVHAVDQEPARCVEHRGVVLGGAVVDPDHDLCAIHRRIVLQRMPASERHVR